MKGLFFAAVLLFALPVFAEETKVYTNAYLEQYGKAPMAEDYGASQKAMRQYKSEKAQEEERARQEAAMKERQAREDADAELARRAVQADERKARAIEDMQRDQHFRDVMRYNRTR